MTSHHPRLLGPDRRPGRFGSASSPSRRTRDLDEDDLDMFMGMVGCRL
jgi:hypothetical protein